MATGSAATLAARHQQQSWIIFGALALSQVIYGVIGVVIAGQPPPAESASPPPDVSIMAIALGGVAVILAGVVIPVLRRSLLPRASRGGGADEARLWAMETPAATAALAKLRTTNIVTWGLAESIAVMGLVLTFLSRETVYILGFAAASLLCFALYAPRKTQALDVLRALPDDLVGR
jgi:hypothetical protein